MFHTRLTGALAIAAATVFVAGCAHESGPADTVNDAAENAVSLVHYRCESGAQIQASYPAENVAVVEYRDETYRMDIARSASGARYTGDRYDWWTKGMGPGATATLATHTDNGPGDTVERCRQLDRPGD